jgi:hypothetical protein
MFMEFDFGIEYVFSSIYIFLNHFIYYSNIIFTFTINVLIIILFFDYCKKIQILDNIKYELSISKKITNNSIKELKLDMNKFTTEQLKYIEINYERYKRDIFNFRSEIKSFKNTITKKDSEKDKILDSLSSKFETFCKKIELDMESFKNDISSTDKELDSINSNFAQIYHTITSEYNKKNADLYDHIMGKISM